MQIAESLKRFGVAEGCTTLLVARFDAGGSDVRHPFLVLFRPYALFHPHIVSSSQTNYYHFNEASNPCGPCFCCSAFLTKLLQRRLLSLHDHEST